MLLGPPKSKAGRRIVGIPGAIIPALRSHLAIFVGTSRARWSSPAPRAVRCGGATSTRCRPGPRAVASIGMTGLAFHDLRYTGNQFAAQSGAALRDLMARMGHDSERAADLPARGPRRRSAHH
jgi:hypothetical protein